MRLAEVKDGVVVNIAEVNPDAIPGFMQDWPEAQSAGPGWTYDGKTYSPPPPPPEKNLEERRATASRPKPDFCNGLADLSLISDEEAVEAAKGTWPPTFSGFLSYLDPRQQRDAQIEFAGRLNIERNHWVVLALVSMQYVTEEQADTLCGVEAPVDAKAQRRAK